MASLSSELKELIVDFFAPLAEGASDSRVLTEWLGVLGQTETVSQNPSLIQIVQKAAALITTLSSFTEQQLESWDGLAALLEQGKQAEQLWADLRAFAANPTLGVAVSGLAEEITALLLASLLRRRYAIFFRVACLLTLIEPAETATPDAPIIDGTTTRRYSRVLDTFQFSAIGDLLSRPGETLASAYLPNGMAAASDAWLAGERLFSLLSFVADEVGLAWNIEHRPLVPPTPSTGQDPDETLPGDGPINIVDPPAPDPITPPPDTFFAAYHPTFRLTLVREAAGEIAIEFSASSLQHPGGIAGFIATPVGELSLSETRNGWTLTFNASAAVPALVVGLDGARLAPAGGPFTSGNALLLVERGGTAGAPAFVFGAATGSRVEIGDLRFSTALTFDPGKADIQVLLEASSGALIIAAGDGDGFLKSVLPAGGSRLDFDLGLAWSNEGGLTVKGGAGLDSTLPIRLSIGPLSIQSMHIGLRAQDADVEFECSTTAGLSLGPVSAVIDRIGIMATVTFPDDGGNLGPADLQIGFKSPSGVGLSIDASGLTGGGFLSHDEAASQYAGMLQLAYQQFQLQAFGLIATKLPTGPGYSLIAMIDANFPPIQLVAGFTLNGVGGLLGINRTISIDALEAGIKAKTLSNFLFAKNPVANATQLLTDLDTFFPAAQGRYVFGPLVQIGWGGPAVTIDLALVLELPDPVRLVLIGELAVLLPEPDAVLVQLHMDVLGTIDFGTDEGSLDAVLHDSRIVHYPLQGAMAFRGCWAGGDKNTFLLSIGGFHPKFQPPPGFPTLQRLAISMPSGHISKLNLNGYLAVSSNTLQIGAHLDIFVGVDGFGISGYLNFDTLIERNPFYFDGDISGGVTLSADGDDIMSLDLSADLTGPAPWHCAGSVHFSVLGFGVTKSFSTTFGDQAPALPTNLVDVGAAIRAALGDPRNYSATLTSNENGLVTLRTPTVSGVVLGHPGASLKIDQKVCPLGLTIQKFGAGAPAGDALFTITLVTADGSAQTPTPLTDEFAPAQFLNLSDDDELAAPSFEAFASGVELGDGALGSGPILSRPIVYETWLVDTPGGTPRPDAGYTPPINWMSGIRTILQNSGRRRYAMPSQPMVRAATLDYIVATTDQIVASGVGAATGQTFAQARTALAAAIAENPDQRGALQIVPHYEVAA